MAGNVAGEQLGEVLVAGRDDQRREPAEGRQQRALALADLARQERLAVAGDDGAASPDARACRSAPGRGPRQHPAGAARHLVQQLEGALAGARVGAGRAPGRHRRCRRWRGCGKWWPLATICVPMMMSASPASMLLMTCAHLGQRRHQVGRQQARARLRKALRHLLGDALDARAAGDERIRLPALGALLGDRQREAAVVAVEPMADSGARPARPCTAGSRCGGRRSGTA